MLNFNVRVLKPPLLWHNLSAYFGKIRYVSEPEVHFQVRQDKSFTNVIAKNLSGNKNFPFSSGFMPVVLKFHLSLFLSVFKPGIVATEFFYGFHIRLQEIEYCQAT